MQSEIVDFPIQKDISYIWTRFNLRWTLTGMVSGFVAGTLMILLAAAFGEILGRELAFPFKLIGVTFLGSSALNVASMKGWVVGFLVHYSLCLFFGLVYAQFVYEKSKSATHLLLGSIAGVAVWLFWSMMFMPAFNEALFHLLPKTLSLFLHVTFGFIFGLTIGLLRKVFK